MSVMMKKKILWLMRSQLTHKATKTLIKCLSDYLSEKFLPQTQDIETNKLPQIPEDCYK